MTSQLASLRDWSGLCFKETISLIGPVKSVRAVEGWGGRLADKLTFWLGGSFIQRNVGR